MVQIIGIFFPRKSFGFFYNFFSIIFQFCTHPSSANIKYALAGTQLFMQTGDLSVTLSVSVLVLILSSVRSHSPDKQWLISLWVSSASVRSVCGANLWGWKSDGVEIRIWWRVITTSPHFKAGGVKLNHWTGWSCGPHRINMSVVLTVLQPKV